MNVELCRVRTGDGLFLDGALASPSSSARRTLPADAFLLVHGTGSNFYAPGVLETFARQAVAAGSAALRVNTRGHDGLCSIPAVRGSVQGGATYETISDCRLDLSAWIAFLAERGYRRIALVGHSMGGVKSVYTLAHETFPEIGWLVGISPPRFCHAHFLSHPNCDDFRADFARAQSLVSAGRPDELIRVTQPLPFLATAAGFLAKYGPHDDYDLVRHLPNVRCPARIIVGSRTVADSPAFDTLPQQIERLAAPLPHISLRLIEGANIHYSNRPETPFDDVALWLGG